METEKEKEKEKSKGKRMKRQDITQQGQLKRRRAIFFFFAFFSFEQGTFVFFTDFMKKNFNLSRAGTVIS